MFKFSCYPQHISTKKPSYFLSVSMIGKNNKNINIKWKISHAFNSVSSFHWWIILQIKPSFVLHTDQSLPSLLCSCSLLLPPIYSPHPLLCLCSERGRPPIIVNTARHIKLRKNEVPPLHQVWARQSSMGNRFQKAASSARHRS